MRIALINDFPEASGIGNYAFSLFRELGKAGIETEMVFLGKAKQEQGVRALGAGLEIPFLKKTLNNLYYFPSRIPKDFDVFHLSNQFLGKVCGKRKPVVVGCMDLIPFVLEKDYPWALRFWLRQGINGIKKSKKVISISDYTKQDAVKILGISKEKVQTVYLACDEKLFRKRDKKKARKELRLSEKGVLLLNVGSEEPRKNIPFLLKAFARIKEKIPEAKLIRVGEQRKETVEMIARLGLRDNVKYFHQVSKQRIALLYNAADVFLFPSYYEGFGLPVLEAMSSGTAVVCSDKTSLPEVGGNAVVYDGVGNKESFAGKVLNVLDSSSLMNSLQKKGLQQAKKFSWKQCARETIAVYEEAMK